MKIVLCPKALKQYILEGSPHPEAGFLREFLSNTEKGIIANEVWETFRFKVMGASTNKPNANNFIAHNRAFVTPEEMKRGADFEEIAATQEHSTQIHIEKTKSLLSRSYADVDFFISPEPDLYSDVVNIDKITVKTAEQFFVDCMGKEKYRKILEAYLNRTITGNSFSP